MRLKQTPTRRLALSVFVASAGSLLSANQATLAGGHGPIYRTLDAIAGGIEMAIDVATAKGKHGSSCDETVCDDGCDPMMLTEMGPETQSYDLMMPPTLPHSYGTPGPETTAIPQMQMRTAPTPAPTPIPAPAPSPAQPITPADDDWLDSFSPEPAPSASAPPRRGLPTPPPAVAPKPRANGQQPSVQPKRNQLRSPAETFDSLPDPFKDDQTRSPKTSPTRQVGYWEPW